VHRKVEHTSIICTVDQTNGQFLEVITLNHYSQQNSKKS